MFTSGQRAFDVAPCPFGFPGCDSTSAVVSRAAPSRGSRASSPAARPQAPVRRKARPFSDLRPGALVLAFTALAGMRQGLLLVRPETVVRWHRQGFRLYWRWKSRSRCPGRPRIEREIRELILEMHRANPTWGAPRIHGELLKLGLRLAQSTVSKYVPRHRKPPSQSWRTFLRNHPIAIDFAVVSTVRFGLLYVFVVLGLERR